MNVVYVAKVISDHFFHLPLITTIRGPCNETQMKMEKQMRKKKNQKKRKMQRKDEQLMWKRKQNSKL